MTMKLTTMIEQIGIFNGSVEYPPHNQAAVRPPKNSPVDKGSLFILAETQGQIARLDAVEQRLVALVRDTYYPARGGITAGLRRAINAANLWLYEQNSAATPDKQVIAGVLAAVIRDEDLFVAQVGPTVFYSCVSKVIRRHPDTTPWLNPAPLPIAGKAGSALGRRHYVEAHISHFQLQPDDILLLADARLAQQVDEPDLMQLLPRETLEIVAQYLTQTVENGAGSAMIIQVSGTGTVKRTGLNVLEKAPAVAAVAGEKGFNLTLPTLLPKRKESHPTPEPIQPHGYDDRSEQHFEAAEATAYDGPANSLSNLGAQVGRAARKGSAAMLGGMALLGGGLQTVLRLVLPGAQNDRPPLKQAGQQAQLSGGTPSRRALKTVAIALPIAILLVTALMVWYRGYSKETEYTAYLTEAQERYAQAQQAAPAEAIDLLAEAEARLEQAATIKANQPEIELLQTNIIQQRDTIGKIERLYYVPELYRYSDPGSTPNDVIVQGVDVYMLDRGLNRVMHHTLDDIGDTILPQEGSPVLVQQGQQLENHTVGEIEDMVWMAAAGGRQTSDLLILTSEGLLEYNLDWGAGAIPISGAEQWQDPVAVGSYFGNFYLLDPAANLLHRYWPTVDGYENPSESYFPDPAAVDLSGAVDMAIDGSIYILYQNGEIRKFLGGEPTLFQLTGLDIPLRDPTAIFTAPDEQVQYLYVADSGNQRIVQLTKEGQFVRQFKPRLEEGLVFDDLRAVYVDEIGEKMYVLNGNSLYAPNIPAN